MSEDAETSRKIKKSPRRNVIIFDGGEELTPKIRVMASKNGMSVSQAVRLLVRKALMSAKDDRTIVVTIPNEALIREQV